MSTPPPAAVAPAISGIEAAVDRLQQSQRLAGLSIDWPGLKSFYAAGAPALWVGPTGYSALGSQLQQQVPKALAAGMPVPADIQAAWAGLPPLLSPVAPVERAADIEAMMSALYIAGAYDATSVLGNQPNPGVELLGSLRNAKDPARAVAMQFPSFHMFWRLHAVLPTYVDYYQRGGWPTVSGTEKIEPGDKGPRVRQVAERLLATGELRTLGTDPELYDPALEVAVRVFQKAHGLNDDGVIGKRTIEEMNVSAEQRLKMVLLNLERMRAESPDMEDRFVFVNVPSTELRVIENGVTTYHANAIVGKQSRKTPLLRSVIFQAKLNPDWSVPAKIAAIDMLKHELDEPGYFASKNVRVYTSDGRQIDPRTVNWKEVKQGGHFPYRLKQDAGPENALGPMKLDFQNDHSVFIHGTSAPKLFAKQDRFFSSGCVRVDDPLGLATFLLQDDSSWNRERVEDIVKGGKTTYAKLARPIPLHIVYMTAWVDEQGVANFRNDVYKRDPRVTIPSGLTVPTLIAQQEGGGSAPARQGNNK
ncbi:L,D-transpeptidase family protein [Dongia deserti]|uniref:L,D-transpeptidase family protein n=1 Tax=Dongia deserti TaxID=2268030 RepID=UPI0013C4481B|nr:L,D-transpeptidase family protein [Dongia deserti]